MLVEPLPVEEHRDELLVLARFSPHRPPGVMTTPMRATPCFLLMLMLMLALALGGWSCSRSAERATAPRDPSATTGADAATDGVPDEPVTVDAQQDTAEGSDAVVIEEPSDPPENDLAEEQLTLTPDAEALAEAFAERLTVWRRHDGTRVLTPHCRNGPVPCEERLLAFAALIVEIAQTHDVDPILIGAMAMRESGLDPSALGRRREAGIIQLHPRGAGRDIRYVRDARYRARCQSRVDACQREVLERGIATLARGMAECGGLRGGLGAYASGHCTTSIRYIERVLEERARLRRLVRQARRR